MKIIGVHAEGAFSDYAVIPEVCAWKLAPGTDPELGAVLEPMGVAVHGLLVDAVDGQSVAVIGCGPIGIFAAQAAAALGAHPLFIVEVSPDRLEMAKRIVPCAVAINPGQTDAKAVVRASTDGRGVDVCIELSGSARHPSGLRLVEGRRPHQPRRADGGAGPPQHDRRRHLQRGQGIRNNGQADVEDLVADGATHLQRSRPESRHHAPLPHVRIRRGLRVGAVRQGRQDHPDPVITRQSTTGAHATTSPRLSQHPQRRRMTRRQRARQHSSGPATLRSVAVIVRYYSVSQSLRCSWLS